LCCNFFLLLLLSFLLLLSQDIASGLHVTGFVVWPDGTTAFNISDTIPPRKQSRDVVLDNAVYGMTVCSCSSSFSPFLALSFAPLLLISFCLSWFLSGCALSVHSRLTCFPLEISRSSADQSRIALGLSYHSLWQSRCLYRNALRDSGVWGSGVSADSSLCLLRLFVYVCALGGQIYACLSLFQPQCSVSLYFFFTTK
jgi:hypothetical protein